MVVVDNEADRPAETAVNDCILSKFAHRWVFLEHGDIVLQTIFQRYTDKLYFWRGCGHGSPNPLLFDSDIDIGIPQLNLLLKVMKNETVRITQNHTYSDYIGKDVCLFDQEKWDATKVIQKNWRKCRYDPSYKMCENVLLHNLNDIYTKHNKEIFLE